MGFKVSSQRLQFKTNGHTFLDSVTEILKALFEDKTHALVSFAAE